MSGEAGLKETRHDAAHSCSVSPPGYLALPSKKDLRKSLLGLGQSHRHMDFPLIVHGVCMFFAPPITYGICPGHRTTH